MNKRYMSYIHKLTVRYFLSHATEEQIKMFKMAHPDIDLDPDCRDYKSKQLSRIKRDTKYIIDYMESGNGEKLLEIDNT